MKEREIEEEVGLAIRKWEQMLEQQNRKLQLTPGAKSTLTQMILNIEEDPSPYWPEVEYDSVQRFAISLIPNVLIDMSFSRHLFRYRWRHDKVSSWEIWHNISMALDRWCPVPKEI